MQFTKKNILIITGVLILIIIIIVIIVKYSGDDDLDYVIYVYSTYYDTTMTEEEAKDNRYYKWLKDGSKTKRDVLYSFQWHMACKLTKIKQFSDEDFFNDESNPISKWRQRLFEKIRINNWTWANYTNGDISDMN